MQVWLIDDEQLCINELAWLINKYADIEVARKYTDPLIAVKQIKECTPDAVFVDIDMPGLSGLQAALAMQEQCPGIIVIFVTAHAKYALDAYNAYPLDFLLKPIKEERLDKCIAHLRAQHALLHPKGMPEHSFKIRCFGTFELISGGEIKWGTRRVKELLLYLISRCGAPASKAELLNSLFNGLDDKNTTGNLYMTLYRLKNLLNSIDPDQRAIRLTGDNALALIPGVCDYTDFMRFAKNNGVITEENAAEAAKNLALYRGTYLENECYEWVMEYANEAETEYERISLSLALCHIAADRLPEAESVLNTLLLRNALCEEGHTMLLDIYMKNGNRGAYLERYMQYARLLKKELHIKPAARYREHYARLKH